MPNSKRLGLVSSLLKRLLILLPLYTLMRGIFFAFNHVEFAADSPAQILLAFLLGLRFDVATIAIVNFPFILLSLAPRALLRQRAYDFFLKGVYLFFNLIILGFMVADLKYYQFTGSRITTDVFLLKSEAAAQSSQLIFNYWYLALLFVGCAWYLVRFYARTRVATHKNPLFSGLQKALVLVAAILCARGGPQLKVLKPLHAFSLGEQELGILVLNSGFTLIRSNFDRGLKPVHDFAGGEPEVERILAQKALPNIASSPQQNVVIFIIESYATEFWGAANGGKGYTPFLDTLASKGLFFKNNFANGRRSIEGLPSVLFGVPSLMPTPIAKSNFQSNRWVGLGQILGEHGYHTSFFHGAKTGTMYFDAISKSAGLKDYYPLERYPEPKKDFDGSWGIFDGPFLQFIVGQLSQHPQPFFAVEFTISSHQPYRVPPGMENQFPAGNLKIHRSVGYVDDSLRKFFAAAEKTDWYKNTLFVFTGDHTQETKSINYDTTLGRYMVPLLFFHPGKALPKVDPNRITQQIDIYPSILHFLGLSIPRRPLFGRSVFGNDPGEAVISSNGLDFIVSQDGVLQRDPQNRFAYAPFEGKDTKFRYGEPVPAALTGLETRLKAYRQLFNNGLLQNTFYRNSLEISR